MNLGAFAQETKERSRKVGEVLTNESVIKMAKAGLSTEIIVHKIQDSLGKYELSVEGLVELKNAGVDETIIVAMMTVKPSEKPLEKSQTANVSEYSDSTSPPTISQNGQVVLTRAEALSAAKTITLQKHSLQPSLQALEKELMKRPEWQKLNLSIVEYKENADLKIEISFVHLSLITHRYTFRVYDNRTGTVIAAGETTSWGSLAENLARNIVKELDKVMISNLTPK